MRLHARKLFFGSYVNRIDSKGRLATPALFRRAIDLERDSAIYCIPSSDEPCLDCGGADYIEGLMASIAQLDPFSPRRRSLERVITARTHVLSVDREGRVVLPSALCQHAKLDKKALFAGLGNSFQIWDPQAFERVVEKETAIAGKAKLSLRNPVAGGLPS